jgi:hypothetical protein
MAKVTIFREDISVARDRLLTLREQAEGQFDFSYVESEGSDRIRFDIGGASAWADIAGPDPINYSGDKRIIAKLKKVKL